ncbi:MAG: hypothetical protein ACREFX_15335, partial [Opitutaceae bacterium]
MKKNPSPRRRPHDSGEIELLANSVWRKEGCLPGLEDQYRQEVASQLRATRDLPGDESVQTDGAQSISRQ